MPRLCSVGGTEQLGREFIRVIVPGRLEQVSLRRASRDLPNLGAALVPRPHDLLDPPFTRFVDPVNGKWRRLSTTLPSQMDLSNATIIKGEQNVVCANRTSQNTRR